MPSSVTSARSENLEDVALLSGAALAHLHLVPTKQNVPQALLRSLRADRLCMLGSKLRAKGAGTAVDLFLSEDALSLSVALTWRPWQRHWDVGHAGTTPSRSAGGAGAVRKLTGRAPFWLYGL